MAGNKLLPYAFTNNLYIYTCNAFLTNALGVISTETKIVDEFLETCEKLKLCGVVYSWETTTGFHLINMNKESNDYNEYYNVPSHIEIKEASFQKCGNITSFPKCFAKEYKTTSEKIK